MKPRREKVHAQEQERLQKQELQIKILLGEVVLNQIKEQDPHAEFVLERAIADANARDAQLLKLYRELIISNHSNRR